MRVVAGELGGRRIVAPDGTDVRPTTDRVREAVFNSLGSLGVVDGAIVADLFAGSGAVGIEAMSRGAARCVFVESDARAVRVIEDNVDALGLSERSQVRRGDALSVAPSIDADVVFADPPYDFDRWDDLLARIDAALVVTETGSPLEPGEGWEVVRSRRYGRTWITFLQPSTTDE